MITWPALAVLALLAGASGGIAFAVAFRWLLKRGGMMLRLEDDAPPSAAEEPTPLRAVASPPVNLPGVTEDKHPNRPDPDEIEQSEQRRTRNQGRWRW